MKFFQIYFAILFGEDSNPPRNWGINCRFPFAFVSVKSTSSVPLRKWLITFLIMNCEDWAQRFNTCIFVYFRDSSSLLYSAFLTTRWVHLKYPHFSVCPCFFYLVHNACTLFCLVTGYVSSETNFHQNVRVLFFSHGLQTRSLHYSNDVIIKGISQSQYQQELYSNESCQWK